MNNKYVLVLSSFLLGAWATTASWAAPANDSKNKQWEDTNAWYQFTDKESGGYPASRSRTHTTTKPSASAAAASSGSASATSTSGFASSSPFTPPGQSPSIMGSSGSEDSVSTPYILTPGPGDPAPATVHVETTYEPTLVPGTMGSPYWQGVAPFYGGGGWGGHGLFGGGYGGGWGGGYGGGWRGGLGLYGGGPQIMNRPINKVVQSGPSKASGNYFNPSTVDTTASGSYYAGSGTLPRATPIYQPAPETKDYWGKPGSPLPADQQPE